MVTTPRMVLGGVLISSILIAFLGWITTASLVSPAYTAGSAEKDNPDSADLSIMQGSQNNDSSQSKCLVSPKFPLEVRQWCDLITHHARQNDLSPNLIAALIWQESGGKPKVISSSGAVGLMQIMPRNGVASKFQCINGPCFANRPTIKELKDPEFNIAFGTKMLANLLSKNNNDLREALKSYGPMDVGYSYSNTVMVLAEQYGD